MAVIFTGNGRKPGMGQMGNFQGLFAQFNKSINQSVRIYSWQKKYIQPNLGIKQKLTVLILTLVDLEVLFRGCRKFEFQY